jgi:hypothetical protein
VISFYEVTGYLIKKDTLSRRFFELTGKKVRQYVILMVFLPLLIISCGQKNKNTFSQIKGGINANFSISPASPTAMEPAVLSLTLKDQKGNPIKGADVQYNLTMPGMMMPSNQPQATEASGGQYHSDAIFTMSGDWQVEALVKYGSEQTNFTFNLPVK